MITTRSRIGVKTTTYTTTRPRSLRKTIDVWKRHSRSLDFVAASDFESALMDGDLARAGGIRHRELVMWLRKCGAAAAAAIPRPAAR